MAADDVLFELLHMEIVNVISKSATTENVWHAKALSIVFNTFNNISTAQSLNYVQNKYVPSVCNFDPLKK